MEEHNGSNTNFKIWLLLRIGDGSEVRVLTDKWILNHLTNVVIHSPNKEEREWNVSDLINQDLKVWRRDLIVAKFHKPELIPLKP